MRRLILTSSLTVLLFLAACIGTPLPADKINYAGAWTAAGVSLDISADGFVRYKRLSGNITTKVNAPIKDFKGNSFEVGIWFFTTTFEVSQPPTLENGKWSMVVDGVKLEKAALNI